MQVNAHNSTWLTGEKRKKPVYVCLIYYFPFVTNWKIYSWMKSSVIYYLLSCLYISHESEKENLRSVTSFFFDTPSHTFSLLLTTQTRRRVETNEFEKYIFLR